MYAVVKTGGKQYRVSAGEKLRIEQITADVGQEILLEEVLLVADGEDNVIWTLRREDGAVVGQTGHNGRNAGQFHWIHQIASDSEGSLYTGEVDTGKRIQKFVLVNGGKPQK